MSIILDALRKSEAARRRNEAPELFAAMPTVAAPTRARANGLLWAIGGIGLASLALSLWLMMRANAPLDTDTTTTSADTSAAPNAPEPQSASGAPSDTLPSASTNSVANTANSDIPVMPAPTAPPATPPPSVATTTPPAAPLAAPPVPNPAVDRRAATAMVAPPQRDATANASPPAPPVAVVEPSPPDAFRSPRSDTPLALADLDSGTRKQLPPLKLSMHVWNDAPAQRFVILDGQRLREGDVLGEVVVERITRDGATLSWRGTPLKIEWR